MKTQSLSYPHEIPAMIDLALMSSQSTFHIFDLPYRLSSWALDSSMNAQLWYEGDQLIAWVILQTPFWSLDYVIHPQYEDICLPNILTWADQQAQLLLNSSYGRPVWYTQVFSDQINRIAHLESAGYRSQANVGEDSWSKVLMHRSNQPLEKKHLPKAGFTVRPLSGENEVTAYVQLHQTVFGTTNMQAAWRSRTLKQSNYTPDLDIVVQAPDGTLAAFCIGWIMQDKEGNIHGQIEPLGCHPKFRHFALGRVALCEVVDRMIHRGVHSIWVETDNYRDTAFRLYQSTGFAVNKQVLVFSKEVVTL